MNNEKQLKEKLIKIKESDGNIEKPAEAYALALEMMDNIGSTDSELRDNLILELLWQFILEGTLSREEIKEILRISLSEKHLFHGLGNCEDDSVFNRSFTLLIINAVLGCHGEMHEELLTVEELHEAFEGVLGYAKQEKDVRGYVEGKGWAHSVAHMADTLAAFAACSHLRDCQLMNILAVAKDKFNTYNHVFVNEEAERMATAIVNVIARNVLSGEEVTKWIRDFGSIEPPSSFPNMHYWRENLKNLLRSLYFRLKHVKAPQLYTDEIEKILHVINRRFNERQNYV